MLDLFFLPSLGGRFTISAIQYFEIGLDIAHSNISV
jgi:hypothetical protein